MKLGNHVHLLTGLESRPAWGAWIETIPSGTLLSTISVAPRVGRVD